MVRKVGKNLGKVSYTSTLTAVDNGKLGMRILPPLYSNCSACAVRRYFSKGDPPKTAKKSSPTFIENLCANRPPHFQSLLVVAAEMNPPPQP